MRQRPGHSPAKFLLVALADMAEPVGCTVVIDVPYLCAVTEQDRKTVLSNVGRLIDAGLLADTGERTGATRSVRVFRLAAAASYPESGTASARSYPETGIACYHHYDRLDDTAGNSQGSDCSEELPSEYPCISSSVFNKEQREGEVRGSGGKENRAAPGAATPKRSAQRVSGQHITFADWRASMRARSERLIAADDPVFDYAESAGIDRDLIAVQWGRFVDTYTHDRPTKTYVGTIGWRGAFRNSVRGNWFRLWRFDDAGRLAMTSDGQQALNAFQATAAARGAATTTTTGDVAQTARRETQVSPSTSTLPGSTEPA